LFDCGIHRSQTSLQNDRLVQRHVETTCTASGFRSSTPAIRASGVKRLLLLCPYSFALRGAKTREKEKGKKKNLQRGNEHGCHVAFPCEVGCAILRSRKRQAYNFTMHMSTRRSPNGSIEVVISRDAMPCKHMHNKAF